jgi:hypothetical protein
MNSPGDIRPPRSGPSRRPEPGRRAGEAGTRGDDGWTEADIVWELWNLRALQPDAGRADLLEIKRRQELLLAREREALAGLWAGDRDILAPGHGFLEKNPELATGVTVSMHLGPYQLLAEPYLAAGLEPAILLNRKAMESFRPNTGAFLRRLGHRDAIQWIPVGRRSFVPKLVRAIRSGRPVLIYLDGNSGDRGMAETRTRGLRYRLPGREIRVRTGLARLVCRLGCPVHRVSLHWTDHWDLAWRRDPTLSWSSRDDPDVVTRQLFDWCFGRIMARPEQWQYWAMLRESSSCFGFSRLKEVRVPSGLREDYQQAYAICLERSPQTVRLILEKKVEVWPGDVLADLTEDRFYPAAGLRDKDLELLRTGQPTLAALSAYHGQAWVKFHGLRLCLLGMARLGG